jgi:hypothetical protein
VLLLALIVLSLGGSLRLKSVLLTWNFLLLMRLPLALRLMLVLGALLAWQVKLHLFKLGRCLLDFFSVRPLLLRL